MASCGGNKFDSIKEKVKRLKSHYDKGGISEMACQLKKDLDEWKDIHIKIAVTGRSGVGKSSFVNSIRGITADDTEYNPAAVDVKECTTEVKEYTYPGNSDFRVYDLPGLGTKEFQKKTYLADVSFDQYDFFIIISETRFMDEDLWLAKQVEGKGKPFYFVRSKIENDIRSDKRAHPRTHKEADLMNKVREDIKSNLEGFTIKEIFLIDNYDTEKYEFGALMKKLIRDSNEILQDALAFSLTCISKEVIEEKKKKLGRRIPLISFVAGVMTLDNPKDSGFISSEVKFFGEQFKVDTTSLLAGSKACALSEDERSKVQEKMYSHEKTVSENMINALCHISNYIPIVGNIALGIKCANFLEKCLDETAEKAMDIHGLMTGSLAKEVHIEINKK